MGLKQLFAKFMKYVAETAELNEAYYAGEKRRSRTSYTPDKRVARAQRVLPTKQSKRNTAQYIDLETQRRIMLSLELCKMWAHTINTTYNPPTFFDAILTFEAQCRSLIKYEASGVFSEQMPSESLDDFLQKKDAVTRAFIDRYCKYAKDSLKLYRTNEEKLKKMREHSSLMSPFYERMSRDNQDYFDDQESAIYDLYAYPYES